MFVYWGIFVILAVGAMLNREESGRTRVLFMLLASVPIAVMIGTRWKIGPDWNAYFDIFNYSKLFSLGESITHADPGYFILSWAVHQFHAPFWVLNCICGAVFTAGLAAFARRQPNPWLAVLVALPYLVIVVAMSGNRQSLALGFLFFALNAFEQEKLNRFLLLTIVAALFHGSVMLMVPLCLLTYSRNGLQRALLLLAAAILAYYFFSRSFSVYAHRYSSEKIQSTGVAYRLAMNGLSALIFLVFQRRFGFGEHERGLWRNISIVTLALVGFLVVVPSSTAIDRFLLYLVPLQFVVLSRLPSALDERRQSVGQVTLLVIAYAAAVQFTFLQFGTYANYYIPYRSILLG